MNIDISYYVWVFLRRLHIFVVIAAALSAAGVYVAMTLPAVYDARARLLVESPQIPTELAASTVSTQAEEQLAVLEQRLMTRANLLDIARELEVFRSEDPLTPDEIVDKMREQTSMWIEGGGRTAQATVMTIGFSSADPRTASAVANEYVTRILEQTAELRRGMAGNTQQFFEDEVERLGTELDSQSARIAEFKSANSQALPDSLEFRLNRQSDLQEQLAQIRRQLRSTEEERKSVVDAYESGGRLSVDLESMTEEERRLRQLQDELESALAVYSPNNPKVQLLKTRVARLEQQVADSGVEGADGADPRETLLNMQLAQIDAREAYLVEQREILRGDLERLEDSIRKTPENAIVLDALERDYQNIQSQYNSAVNRLATASTGERIELLSKGERITVLEQATTPSRPNSPNRVKIAGAGGAAGIALGAAVIVLLELLNQSIRRPVDLQRSLGITPLVTLPYIRTRREVIVKRSTVAALVLAVIIGTPATLWAVHTYYLPLDLIFDRIASKMLP